MKVITVVGTRPEIIKLSRVITTLDRNVDHIFIHSGQNYDYNLNQIFFNDMEIRKPDYTFNIGKRETPISAIAETMTNLDEVFACEKPDSMLILGDTNSCFAAAYTAKRRKIPIFHMEAGNRCFDQRVPEEINRVTIDHISDINLPYSSIARECLIREGLPTDRVIKTGSPMQEVLSFYQKKIESSSVLTELKLKKKEFFLVSCHREENIDCSEKFKAFITLLEKLVEKYNQRVIVSTHPRTKQKLTLEKIAVSPKIDFMEPFGFLDYAKLQMNARVVLSDSGTITEESSILDFPALNLRESHERHEGMEEGAVILTGFNIENILVCIDLLDRQIGMEPVTDYCVHNVSEKVVRIILSYTDYINRTVWKKY